MQLIFAICFSMGPLGPGSCSRAPFPYITQQTRPQTVKQLAVTVSHQQCSLAFALQRQHLQVSDLRVGGMMEDLRSCTTETSLLCFHCYLVLAFNTWGREYLTHVSLFCFDINNHSI